MDRRDFLSFSAAASVSAAGLALPGAAAGNDGMPFSFVHLTDLHVQPELAAPEGVRQCLAEILKLDPRPDFIITGGDLIMDALHEDAERIELQWRLFDEIFRDFPLPVHHVIGNHDVGGWSSRAKIAKDSPLYGKDFFAKHYGQGKTYRQFSHKGWQFILLDSIGQAADGPDYIGLIDEPQLDWLRGVLEETGPKTPIVLVTHIPFHSAFHQLVAGPTKPVPAYGLVNNVHQFRQLLAKYNVRLVLSGHGHIRERIELAGTTHIQSGAVSGRWWKGELLGEDECFATIACRGDNFDYQYRSYNWTARAT